MKHYEDIIKAFLWLFGIFIIIIIFMGASCIPKKINNGYNNHYKNVTSYNTNVDLYTPSGIPITTNNYIVQPYMIDRYVNELEECLEITLDRSRFQILIPPDWYTSPCSGQQVFPCDIVRANQIYRNDPNYNICVEQKNLEPTEQCPCACRATIQDENIIVTTPNLLLFKAELARMLTGDNTVWDNERILPCLR